MMRQERQATDRQGRHDLTRSLWQLRPEDVAVRDVEADATTNDDIAAYLRRNHRSVPESSQTQLRMRRKWEHEKQRLRDRCRLAPEDREAWQLERVRSLVDTAYATVPFYRALYESVGFEPGAIVTWDDFRQLPVVNKKMMVDAEVGPELVRDARRRTVHSSRTSGSSGLNLTIYQDNASIDHRSLLHLRHCEVGLRSPLEPDDWRYGVYFTADRFTSLLGAYPFVTVSQDCPVPLLVRHVAEIRPRLMAAFPSYLQRLADEQVALDALGVEAVYTNSERSSHEERAKYSEIFRVPVLDEYSSEEMSLLAHECLERQYHIVEDSAYLEVAEPDQQGFGRMLGTSLGNFFMPFIRYDQGDIVRLGPADGTCGCGSRFRVIEAFRGREDEFLRDGPDRIVPSDAVLGLCDRTLVLAESNVRQYQIVQSSPDRIELRIQLSHPVARDSHNPVVAEFVRELPALFSRVTVAVDIVYVDDFDQFDTFASGKRRLIYVTGAWAGQAGRTTHG